MMRFHRRAVFLPWVTRYVSTVRDDHPVGLPRLESYPVAWTGRAIPRRDQVSFGPGGCNWRYRSSANIWRNGVDRSAERCSPGASARRRGGDRIIRLAECVLRGAGVSSCSMDSHHAGIAPGTLMILNHEPAGVRNVNGGLYET